MNLKQTIENELKEALRNKEELKLSVLRMLSAAIHNKEIEKRTKLSKNPEVKDLAAQSLLGEPRSNFEKVGREKESELNEEETLGVIRSEAKKRKDSIVEFEKGGRKDLVDKESAELKILEAYLPKEMGDGELEKIVGEAVAGMSGVTAKDFGRVMGEVMKKVKGQASGDRVSAVVKKLLPQ